MRRSQLFFLNGCEVIGNNNGTSLHYEYIDSLNIFTKIIILLNII